jgi:hypothetical protein
MCWISSELCNGNDFNVKRYNNYFYRDLKPCEISDYNDTKRCEDKLNRDI